MEQLIILAVIIALSALHGWWKKRQDSGEAEAESEPWPGQVPGRRPGVPQVGKPAPPPLSPAASLEEQLRRLLQGEQPARPAPPPIIVPPPLPAAPPTRSVFVPQVEIEKSGGLSHRTSSLERSAQSFLMTSRMESKVAEHMHPGGVHGTARSKLESKKTTAPEVRQALGLLRDRQSQRAAIIAGVVLGPPKALEA